MELPDEHILSQWRKQYSNIYSVNVRDRDYYFRALTLDEYDHIRGGDVSSAEIEDRAVETCVLYPGTNELDRLPAGIITSLAEQILNLSGFGEPKQAKSILDEKRQHATNSVLILMKAFILATMPSYTEEYLNHLNFSQLAQKVALAERIIEIQQAILPAAVGPEPNPVTLNIIDPEEEALKQQQEVAKRAAQQTRPGQAGVYDPIAAKLAQALM